MPKTFYYFFWNKAAFIREH